MALPYWKYLQKFNSLPDNKVLVWSEFADDKINPTEEEKFVLWRIENIVGMEEMLVTHTVF